MTTPTALPTLTDEEYFRLYNDGYVNHDKLMRKVQAAVHAKLLPYFAQREREAERAALLHWDRDCVHSPTKCREVHYPSLLTPQPSREITLSNGETYRRVTGRWDVSYLGDWRKAESPECHTAADHDKCAELLRLEEQ